MAFELSIPFHAFRLQLHGSSLPLLRPLQDLAHISTDADLPALAEHYTKMLQAEIAEGELDQLLSWSQADSLKPGKVSVSFPAQPTMADEPPHYAAFSLEFTYYVQEQPERNSLWVIVPALGLELATQQPERIEAVLQEAIALDFARKDRLRYVQDIISTIWFDSVALEACEIELQVPSPGEQPQSQAEQKEPWLPKVAHKLEHKAPAAYGREDALAQLAKALSAGFNRSTLIVGASGTGKTALAWELSRQRGKYRLKKEIWETTASALLSELSKDTGWKQNMSLLCRELAEQPVVLFVRNFMELFESGMYEGSSVSIGEYLKPYVEQGELTLLSECTEEELARIKLKVPESYVDLFQRVSLSEPDDQAIEAMVLRKAKDWAATSSLRLRPEAVQEIIRLSKRFAPYDGMPGRAVRFLENLMHQSGKVRTNWIGRSEVIEQFCEEAGMPRFLIDPSLPMLPDTVRQHFNERVLGQTEAVSAVTGILSMIKTAMSRMGKPIASLLFVGPTGVGKTELAKQLAAFIFSNSDRISRFDMSEYSTPQAVYRLMDADANGSLTSAIRKTPFGVLLFDEIEKAHSDFYDLLLQVLSEGRLTDSRGGLVNFCSSIIIMTSNIGADKLDAKPIGWQPGMDAQLVKDHFLSAAQKYFRPELFNRIDQIVPFGPLSQGVIRKVVEREISLLKAREGLQFQNVNLEVPQAVLDYLAEHGYSPQYGARQLQRIMQEMLTIPLAKALNASEKEELELKAELSGDGIQVKANSHPMAFELLLESYTKEAHANHASELRRQIDTLMEGDAYIELLNEIDRMDFAQATPEQFKRYSEMVKVKPQMEMAAQEIEQLEDKLCLSCLGGLAYKPEWIDELAAFEKTLASRKLSLYTTLYPEENTCELRILGTYVPTFYHFYLELLASKGFECSPFSLWYRSPRGQGKASAPPYFRLALPATWAGEEPVPPKANDQFVGLCFLVEGAAVKVYLQPEKGKHQWEQENAPPQACLVEVGTPAGELPNGLHRRSFGDRALPRRIVSLEFIRDTPFNIKRQYKNNQLVPLIAEKLDSIFESKIHNALL